MTFFSPNLFDSVSVFHQFRKHESGYGIVVQWKRNAHDWSDDCGERFKRERGRELEKKTNSLNVAALGEDENCEGEKV